MAKTVELTQRVNSSYINVTTAEFRDSGVIKLEHAADDTTIYLYPDQVRQLVAALAPDLATVTAERCQ